MRFRLFTLLSLALMGCAETSQGLALVPLFVAGRDNLETINTDGESALTIDRAELAFGPLYLCAGVTAGELCETARLEWLGSVVVDLTSPEPLRAGALTGVTGTVQSWMYDLGISSQLTRDEPFILDAASTLGGTSFVLEGRAQVDDLELPFTVSVAVQQTDDTELGVPVIRKSNSDTFSREVTGDESGLVVRFDLEALVRGIDFRAYVSYERCAVDGPELVCDGALERRCDGETEQSTRDCSERGEICAPRRGCVEALRLTEESQGYRSVRNALMSGARPSFTWD